MVPEEYIRSQADRNAIQNNCYWDEEAANRVIKFAETFVIPMFTGKRIKLLKWQVDWLKQLYGWRLPNGQRRWRKVLLTVSKKNGKSLISAICCLYELFAAGNPSPLVVSASTTKDNAKQIFDQVYNDIKKNPKLKKISKFRPSSRYIKVEEKGAVFSAISNDSGNAEGLNISFCVCDEVHAWKKPDLYRTLEYSTIARPDGLLVVISTAGHDQSHFFFDLVTKAKNILNGNDLDESFFATVYEAPEDSDPEEPATWYAANPSLGTSFSEGDFRRDMVAAKSNVSDWLSFQRYRLNQWVQSENAWLDLLRWDGCEITTVTDLQQYPCYLGIDLSATTDPTSVSAVWHLGSKRFHVRSWSWVCAEGVKRREATNLPKYQQFQAEKWMTITDGNVIDQSKVKSFILELIAKNNVQEIVFDNYNATQLALELGELRTCFTFPQTARYYNAGCKAFEIAIAEKKITHEKNSLLRWAVQNVRLHVDSYGNVKPDRDKSTDKIDPVVSTLMAFSRANDAAAEIIKKRSVYEDRGLLTV